MKRGKLYTINKWNHGLVSPNVFDDGGTWDRLAKKNGYTGEDATYNYMQSKGGLFNLSKIDNPFSKGNISTAGVLAPVVGAALYSGLSDGYSSGAGKVLSGLGSAASALPGPFKFAGPALELVGGGHNRLIGEKVDEKKLAQANADIAERQNMSYAGSFDSIKAPTAMASVAGTYKTGALRGKSSKQTALENRVKDANLYADRFIDNNVGNLMSDQINRGLTNYSAFGGPLGYTSSIDGAIGYGLMSDYLTGLNDRAKMKENDSILKEPKDTLFALGGVLQSHGADWGDGLTIIGAGSSHEMNPYGGVQMGVDSQGTPNLVEEGEVIYDDYVFSDRINVPQEAQKWLGVKGKTLSFADAAKQLEKEIKERPNDPVSRSGFEAQMERLEEEQEFVKRCDSYSIGEIYDVDDNELALLNHNGYEYRKLG